MLLFVPDEDVVLVERESLRFSGIIGLRDSEIRVLLASDILELPKRPLTSRVLGLTSVDPLTSSRLEPLWSVWVMFELLPRGE